MRFTYVIFDVICLCLLAIAGCYQTNSHSREQIFVDDDATLRDHASSSDASERKTKGTNTISTQGAGGSDAGRIQYTSEDNAGGETARDDRISADDAGDENASQSGCIAESDVGDNIATRIDCMRHDPCADSEYCVFDLCLTGCRDLPDLVIPEGLHRCLKGVQNYCNVVIGGTLEVAIYESGDGGGELELNAEEQIVVLPSGLIIADGAGYPSDEGPGAGFVCMLMGGGGAYGGLGGLGACPLGTEFAQDQADFTQSSESRSVYGEKTTQSVEIGSGGASALLGPVGSGTFQRVLGNSGGGAITLTANAITIDGNVSTDGKPVSPRTIGSFGAGSGGGVLMIAETRIAISGKVSARGGSVSRGGCGGGGRIKLFASRGSVTGEIDASGGVSDLGDGAPGEDGTVFVDFDI